MTRTEKRGHQVQLLNGELHGYTSTAFASPKLRTMAHDDRNHYYMTAGEYRTHRMGRREISVHQMWDGLMTRRGFRGTETGRWIKTTRR